MEWAGGEREREEGMPTRLRADVMAVDKSERMNK
jgi:hypothetical protein